MNGTNAREANSELIHAARELSVRLQSSTENIDNIVVNMLYCAVS
jgi:hypothetical protein